MDKTVLISLPVEDLQSLIIDCVNVCLKHNPARQPTEQGNDLLTVQEAAEFLSLTIPTIYSKSSRGELPSCKAPGSKRLYFSREDLSQHIRSGRKKTNREIEAEAHTYLMKKGGSHD